MMTAEGSTLLRRLTSRWRRPTDLSAAPPPPPEPQMETMPPGPAFMQVAPPGAALELTSEAVRAYLAASPLPRLAIGVGKKPLYGWLNTDIEPMAEGVWRMDATQPFPIDDGCLRYVVSEHVIEHMTRDQGAAKLAECFRVLAPGGKVRISTPDMRQYLRLFHAAAGSVEAGFLDMLLAGHPAAADPAAMALNILFHDWGHQFIYSEGLLRQALDQAGFREIRRWRARCSGDPHLRDVERHGYGGVGHTFNEFETLVLEAVRP